MKKISVSATWLFAAVLAFLFSVSASTQTLSLNDGVVVRSTTNPVGVNLGVINDWANGQILKEPNGSSDKTGGNPANTTVLRDEVVAALQSYFGSSSRNNSGILRYSLNGNEGTIENWTEPNRAHRLAGLKTRSFSTLGGDEAMNLSLQDFLAICQFLKVDPYLEISPTISAADAANLVEFLAGPSSTPYGGKRAALGQEEPWTDVFGNIHLSLCNECGNALSLPGQAFSDHGSEIEDERLSDFSNHARDIFAAMRAASYYSTSSFDLVMSVPSTFNYSIEIAVERAHPDSIEIRDYTHFAMNGLTSDASLAQAATVEPFEKVTSPLDPFNLYQSVPSYQSLTSCGASESATCKVNIYGSNRSATSGSTGSGEGVLVALQSLLNMEYYVIGPQSISTFSNYANGAGNGLGAKQKAAAYNSDVAAIDLPTTYLGLQLINQSIIGPMFSCPIANNLTYDFAGSTNGSYSIPALKSVPYIYAFCFENGTKRSLVLINTDLAKSHTLNFAGTNPPAESVTQRQYAPASLNDMNESPAEQNSLNTSATVAIETSTLSSPGSITLPPYSVTALDYTAASEPVSATLTSPALDATLAVSAASTSAEAVPASASSLASENSSAAQLGTAGTQIFNCPSGFSVSGTCGAGFIYPLGQNFDVVGTTSGSTPGLSGSQVMLLQSGIQHSALSFMYQAAQVNDQAFSTTFQFIPNGFTLSLILENSNNNPTFNGASFSGGAGCEGDEYQGFAQAEPPNNVWAIVFSSTDNLTTTASSFAYSSVQMYQSGQSPCLPNDGAATYFGTNKISTSPVPMNSPATSANTSTGHTYSATVVYTGTTVALTLYDVTAGGTCTPITSGTCFSHTWTGVQIPSIVNGTTAWVGLGGSVPSITPSSSEYIGAWSYGTLSAAATPTLSPSAGTYSGTQTVTISDSSSGAIICYNTTGAPATNGLAGCANGTLYTGAISVTSGQTIYTVAGGAGFADSAIGNTAYQIGSTAAQPTFYPASGTYNGNQTVFLNAAQGTVICYNTTGSPATNGTTGCTAGTLYTGPITVSSNETLYAASGGPGLTNSLVGASAYTINPFAGAAPANSPTYSPLPGTYSGTQNVTIASTTPSSYICYTLAASAPTLLPQTNNVGGCTVGTLYSGPVSVPSSQSLYAMASTKQLGPPSSLTVGAYVITSGAQATSPSCTPGSGSSSSPITVTCSNPNSGTTIMCYTENGTTPATNGTGTACSSGTALSGTSGNITISSTTAKLNLVAGTSALSDSKVSSYGAYTISAVLPAPTFSVAAGTYAISQSVAISDSTSGTTIYYTTNGTAPTTSSTVYTGAITVSSTETLEAIAVETGSTNSAVASATYTITPAVPAPTFSPVPGTYTTSQLVTISETTSGTTIYYTTNGTTPTASSTAYTGPITVSSTETLEAIALVTGDSNAVGMATYTICPVLPAPVFSPAAGSYTTTQSVAISNATAGTTIYYTTNGTTPTTSSTVYLGPITVSASETLEAIAVETGYTNSPTSSASYTISSSTSGTPLAYEPFAETGTTPFALNAASGGDSGWGAAWVVQNTNVAVPGYNIASANPLTYSNLATTGHYAVGGNDYVGAGRQLNVSASGPFGSGSTNYLSGDLIGAPGTTIWISFLLRQDASGGSPYVALNANSGATSWSISSTNLEVGAFGGYWGLQYSGTTVSSKVAVTTGQPALLVLEETFGATNVVNLYVDPTSLGGAAPATTSATYSTANSLAFQSFAYYGGSGAGDSSLADIRIGTSYAAVTPSSLQSQTITFAQPTSPVVYPGTSSVALSATATSGLPAVFSVDSSSTATGTINGSTLTITGTGTIVIDANQAGNSSYSAAPQVQRSIAVNMPAAATPTFSLAGGTYNGTQSVTLASTTTGATIYYTTNGTTPTTSSSLYSGPLTVSASETLEAIAVKTGYTNSPVASVAYTISISVPAPTFSPAAGTYTTAQTVAISDSTPGTTIYYTTNGTTPTSSSTVYAGPITVSSTETLQAIAIVTGDSNAVGTAIYTIAPVLPAPTFSLATGTYTTTQSVTISDVTAGTTVYYTTNGTTPTTSSSVYSGPITVSSSETLEAIAVETGHTNSPVTTAAYTIAPVLPAPAFSLSAGTYTTAQTVTVSDSTAGTTIYYTTNGTTPTASSTVYSGPITVSASETLEAIAVETGYTNSPVTTAAYTIAPVLPAPTFSLSAGTYTTAQTVTVSDSTAGTTIYYTSNGTTPTTSSTVYSGPITVSASETLEAIAVETGYTNSPAATAAYTIAPVLPAPAFSLSAGTYTTAQTVTVSDSTAGTTIYYTSNGTTPTTSSTVYSGPITVSASETLEAIAVETGYTGSPVATAVYAISSGSTASAVLISPAAGSALAFSTTFTWTAGTGVSHYELWLGTTSGASNLYNSGSITATSAAAVVPMNGAAVYAELWSDINGTWQSTIYTFTEGAGGATPTPAALISPAAGSVLSFSTTFTWSAGAGVSHYELWLGTTSGASNLYNSGSITATSAAAVVPMDGAAVYAELWSDINGIWQSTTYTFTEGAGGATPTPAALISPAAGSVLSFSTTFTWSAGAGVSHYELWLGTTSGASDLYNSGCITATSAAAVVPMNGATVYAELWSDINGTWQSTIYTFTEGAGGATPTRAALITPAAGSVLSFSTTFTWSAGAGVTKYALWLGTTSGASDLYNSGYITATSATAVVPLNGATVYAELWSEINGTWQSITYTFTEGQ